MTAGTPTDTIYAKNLPLSWRDGDLTTLFGSHGTVVDCRMLPVRGVAPGSSALIRMSTIEEAGRAIKHLHGTVPMGASLPLIVRYADTPQEKAQKLLRSQQSKQQQQQQRTGPVLNSTMVVPPQFASLWGQQALLSQANARLPAASTPARVVVTGLPRDADNLLLYQLFAPFGAVLQLSIEEDPNTRTATAVINMGSQLEATLAASMDGARIGDHVIRVSMAGLDRTGNGNGGRNGSGSETMGGSHASSMTAAYGYGDGSAQGTVPSPALQGLPNLTQSLLGNSAPGSGKAVAHSMPEQANLQELMKAFGTGAYHMPFSGLGPFT